MTELTFAQAFEKASNAFAEIESVAKDFSGDIDELLEMPPSPEVLARYLVLTLPIEGMGFYDKTYWLAVADRMGPEYIKALRRVAAFMAKVDEF